MLLALWDTFKREGIEIPYPVREVHMVSRPEAGKKKMKSARA